MKEGVCVCVYVRGKILEVPCGCVCSTSGVSGGGLRAQCGCVRGGQVRDKVALRTERQCVDDDDDDEERRKKKKAVLIVQVTQSPPLTTL